MSKVIRIDNQVYEQLRVKASSMDITTFPTANKVLRSILGLDAPPAEDTVPAEDACPKCGENHIDNLVIDDEHVTCESCKNEYDLKGAIPEPARP